MRDERHDRYVLEYIDLDGDRYATRLPANLEIRDGKVWILTDNTEDGIATELFAEGVPKQQIVLGFYPTAVRETGGVCGGVTLDPTIASVGGEFAIDAAVRMLKSKHDPVLRNPRVHQVHGDAILRSILMNPELTVLQLHVDPGAMDALEAVPTLIQDQVMAGVRIADDDRLESIRTAVELCPITENIANECSIQRW